MSPSPEAAEAAAADATVAAAPVPHVTEWSGFVIASEVESPTHIRPTEDAIWPLMQEGILFEVGAVPQAMEVALEWEGEGSMMIMLHSHKAHGSNAYVEHVTPLDAENPKCLRVPVEDLVEGVWQVMIHTEGVRNAAFTLRMALVGAEGSILEDRHGHWIQDGMFEVDEHPVEACQLLVSAPDA